MEAYAILSWLSVNRPLATCTVVPATGPVTVPGGLAEAPPTAYLNQPDLAVLARARVRMRGGEDLDDRHRVA